MPAAKAKHKPAAKAAKRRPRKPPAPAVPRPGEQWLTIPEAQAVLRCCRATVYNLIDRGELPRVHIGRSARISRAALDAYLEEQSTPRAS
jgi:excisionase family DNA binding protein